eukprot:3267312-Amphidinium_carterae.6
MRTEVNTLRLNGDVLTHPVQWQTVAANLAHCQESDAARAGLTDLSRKMDEILTQTVRHQEILDTPWVENIKTGVTHIMHVQSLGHAHEWRVASPLWLELRPRMSYTSAGGW